MSIGTIVYYLLWPLVLVALSVYWFFHIVTLLCEISVEYVRGMHEDIKNL